MAAFTMAGPAGEEVPAIFVDRAGAKVALQQQYTRNSKGSLGLVLQRITARDESGAITAHGTKQLPNGMLAADGPPVTLSSAGRDIVPFVQAHIVRDRTRYVNGALVGARDIFNVRPAPLPRVDLLALLLCSPLQLYGLLEEERSSVLTNLSRLIICLRLPCAHPMTAAHLPKLTPCTHIQKTRVVANMAANSLEERARTPDLACCARAGGPGITGGHRATFLQSPHGVAYALSAAQAACTGVITTSACTCAAWKIRR